MNSTLFVGGLDIDGGSVSSAPGGAGALFENGGFYSLHRVRLYGGIVNSTSDIGGGGITKTDIAALKLDETSILDNSVSVGINGGDEAQGGGLRALGPGPVVIENSTIAGNSATGSGSSDGWGGGLYLASPTTLLNVTVTSNTATGGGNTTVGTDGGIGGGIYAAAPLTADFSTLVGNSATGQGMSLAHGGNLAVAGGQTATVGNSILSGGIAAAGGANCAHGAPFGTLTGQGRNLDSGTTCGFGPGHLENTDPALGALDANGGPTDTLLPAATSPVIGAATECPPPISRDQRNNPRPIGPGCEIGAVERGPNLGLAVFDAPTVVDTGEEFDVILRVGNSAIDATGEAAVVVPLPTGLELAGSDPVASCSGGRLVTCSLGVIGGPFKNTQLTIRLRAVKPGRVELRLTTSSGLPTALANEASVGWTIQIRDATAPVIKGLSLSNRVFRVQQPAAASQRRRRAPKGTKIRFRLSERALVLFTVERRVHGRRVGSRCRRLTRRNRGRPSCARFQRVGRFQRAGAAAGVNRVPFSGRLRMGSRPIALPPARYRLNLAAEDLRGNRSKTSRIGFRIVR